MAGPAFNGRSPGATSPRAAPPRALALALALSLLALSRSSPASAYPSWAGCKQPTGPSGAHNGLVQDDGIVIELLDPDTSIVATDYAPGAPYTVRVTSSDGEDYAMLLTGPDDVCETERRRKVSHSTAVTMPVAGSSATFVVTLSHSETAFRQHSAVFEAASAGAAPAEPSSEPSLPPSSLPPRDVASPPPPRSPPPPSPPPSPSPPPEASECAPATASGFDCVAEIIPGKLAISWATPTAPAVGRKLAAGEASVRVRIDAHASLNTEYVAVGLGAGAKMIGADAAVAWSEDDVARAAAYRLDSYSNPEDGSCGDGGPCPFSDLEGASGADGSVALEATVAMADASNVVLIWAYGPRWKGFHTARVRSALSFPRETLAHTQTDALRSRPLFPSRPTH